MTVEELRTACLKSTTGTIALVSPNQKRPLPRMKAELLCAHGTRDIPGSSVWLYETKRILKALERVR